ncbi:hypothetical protein BDB01DRAFT_781167 [Pilobolus umbonatus]|nr:hypothetical protein BDB01DRAFT_781167 [Pilobolus umbonatus]
MINSDTLQDIKAISIQNSPCSMSISSLPSSPPLSIISEEIKTIFVVGFPENMQEREFQNMFLFAKGFEGASLKWHSRDQDDTEYHVLLSNKKQMIGFAKFSSRQGALEAIELIDGKRIDSDKNTILKAEMAKKNLHIKRRVVTSSSSHNQLNEHSPINIQRKEGIQLISTHYDPSSNYESFSPLPSDLLSPEDYSDSYFHGLYASTMFKQESIFGNCPTSLANHHSTTSHINNNTLSSFPLFSKSGFSDIDNNDPYHYHSKSIPVPNHEHNSGGITGFASHNIPHQDEPSFLAQKMGESKMIFRNNGITNHADQNPPCNTLYIGNLPSSTSEDELRALFSNCDGYKRMCFRTKPQGHMCFVEFEDVVYATQTMTLLQGYLLSNSIKGGIRLSFSKNPLFIKSHKAAHNKNNIVFNYQQIGTALLADLNNSL